MECRITSTRARRAGMTLIEVLVSSVLILTLVTSMGGLYVYFTRAFAGLENYMGMDSKSRYALDRMSKEIRQADSLVFYSTNKLTFQLSTNQVSFTYDPAGKTLTRSSSGKPDEELLAGCDYLRYDMYKRTTIKGAYDLYPTTSPANCKVVQLSWVCSRDILGKKINSEDVQSAKVVIRKQQP